MIRLVATDVDGTLMAPGEKVPEGNFVALREASARGVHLALATVRTRKTAERITTSLGVPCSLICQGGATVFDAGGRLLFEHAIPLDLAREMAAFADEQGIGLLATVDGEHRWGPGYVPGLPGLQDRPPPLRTNSEAVTKGPTRFMATGKRDVDLLRKRFESAPLRIARHFAADGSVVDVAITASGATKEGGLAVLCESLGIGLQEVLAAGDAEAEIGMIRAAGIGIAVANAMPEVRAVADWVAPAAEECGIAAALRRFVLNPGPGPGR
jgi:hydroxymethylpyrimidine pyrophosphatase-like HAD family hydrolase